MEDAELVERDGVLYVRFADGYEMPYEGADVQFIDQPDPNLPSPDDQATALDAIISRPRQGYQFGDVGARAGNETLAAAGDVLANAGNVTRAALPESMQPYLSPAWGRIPDIGLAGLLGLVGGVEKGVGYGAEVLDAGARGIMDMLGVTPRYAPGTGAEALARDILGGLEVTGVGPEARTLEALGRTAKTMRGVR